MTKRSLIQRSSLLLAFLALSAFLFYIGKGHTLIIDTNAVTIDGKELRSAETLSVSIDGKEPEPMGRAERIMATVAGPRHRILIQVESGEARQVELPFRISTWMDTALVSVPAILGGAPAQYCVTKFVPPPREEAPAEKMQQQVDAPAAGTPAAGTPAPPAP